MIELVLYTRTGCHLCEEMAAGLDALREGLGFRVRAIEVGWEGPLADRHGDLVPRLILNDVEVCHYFLDEAALRGAIDTARQTG